MSEDQLSEIVDTIPALAWSEAHVCWVFEYQQSAIIGKLAQKVRFSGSKRLLSERGRDRTKTNGFVLILVLLGVLHSALAQMTGGSISGRVTDASSAVIPGATVTLENQATGQTRTLNTNEKGFYNAPSLSPGLYSAISAHTGFGDLVKKNLPVDVGQELVVDFQLNVGTFKNSVDVTAETHGVALASSTLIDVVDGQ